jgi:uncharacterized membrane protein YczE
MATPTKTRPWPLWARLAQMYIGLALYGVAIALEVRAGLGLDPWDVFHQGLARVLGISIGTCVILVGGIVLLLWIPLRERPGLGTISNVIVIGLGIDVALGYLPVPNGIALRIVTLVGGIVLCGIATGAYIGAGFGPGPRDGLMMGIARRGHSIRVSRTVIEVSVLVVGFALGGRVGLGTILFAVSIGPIAHLTIPFFRRMAPT